MTVGLVQDERETLSPRAVDVVVLGAGPAGLAAAWYSARHGRSVVVIDRAGVVGGLAASITVAGQRVDLGSHRLHPSIRPDLLADLVALIGTDLQRRERRGRIRLDGRWLGFPLRPVDLARNARPGFSAGVVRDLAMAPWRRRKGVDGADFATRVRQGMGPTIASTFYEPYARKLWAVEAEQLDGELFRRRVGARSAAAVLRRVVTSREPPSFWYPAGGFGQIVEALAQGVAELGGSIELDTELRRVACREDGRVVVESSAGRLLASTVVSTIPAGALAVLTSAPAEVLDAAARLEHRGAVLVYLVVPQSSYSPFDAHYFPEPGVRMARLSEPKRYRDSAADPAGATVLCAEVPVSVGDDVWNAADEDLAALIRRDIIAVGLPDPSPIGWHVDRRSHVYPVYRQGFGRWQRRVDAWVDGLSGVAALGRQALFAHDNTHHALVMGHAVAQCLDGAGRLDRAAWANVRAPFAEHVVED